MGYKQLFEFTRQERNGIIIFFVLSIAVCLIGAFWPKTNPNEIQLDLAKYYLPEDSVINEDENDYVFNDFNYSGKDKHQQVSKQRFKFDPNIINYDSIILLGFSKFGAKSLTNFISKGGKIKDISKLKTIFGLDTNLINQLEPLISFEAGIKLPLFTENGTQSFVKEVVIPNPIDINSADSLEWLALKGIGPYTVTKILKYRNKLGGFLTIQQFKEAELLKDSLFEQLAPLFEINSGIYKQININTADYREMISHPYFTPETASAIIKYRNQHGIFTDPKHIRRIKSLKEEWGNKILPYLKLE